MLAPDCFYGNVVFCLVAEVEINKLRTEEAGLRDALLKMQALNEGLGQDKIELNRIIMHLEQEKATLQVCDILRPVLYSTGPYMLIIYSYFGKARIKQVG